MSGVRAMLCDTHRHSHRAADAMSRADHARRERSSRSPTSRARHAAAGVATSVPGFLLRLPRAASLLAPLALLLAALAFAGPAAAQTSVTLVSNNGQSFSDSHAGDFSRQYATSFTTGGSREGYVLNRVDAYLKQQTGAGAVAISTTISIYTDAFGIPGTWIGAGRKSGLPATLQVSIYDNALFSGPAGINLDATTRYWVVVSPSADQGDLSKMLVGGTSSDGEDSGGFPAWSIGNHRLWKSSGTSWTTSNTNMNALRMNLVGHANDTTAPVLRSAKVNTDGTELTLYYDEELDPNSTPAHARFSTNIGGDGQALPRDGTGTQREAPVTVSGSTVTMKLVENSANAVTSSQTVAMGYNAAAAASPLRNLAGLKAARVSGLAWIIREDGDSGGDTGASVWYKRCAHKRLATTEAPA